MLKHMKLYPDHGPCEEPLKQPPPPLPPTVVVASLSPLYPWPETSSRTWSNT
ncbi:Putative LOC100900174 [Caligus rogercresseyi]|uniref:LOC100900174 n=1 Tax=Caligus rogercresseyi TaxID=217165 RepID=A0A7T8JU66_CALRO|nr:Putative LOC100900174 [Caligus rogercresseyi]